MDCANNITMLLGVSLLSESSGPCLYWSRYAERSSICALLLQIIDLSAPDLAPEGWAEETLPLQGPFTDISVYELHIRDFSASDNTVPDHLKGKYLAFSLVRSSRQSWGMLLR